jgi:hypothetical protein
VEEGVPNYVFAVSAGQLIRFDRDPGKALYAERLERGESPRWILECKHLDSAANLEAISHQRAIELAGSTELLDMPSEVSVDPGDVEWIDDEERVAWLNDAIATTLSGIKSRNSAWLEVVMSSPGSWDYDRAIDSLAWMRRAYVTIEAMIQERDTIIRRQKMRAETDYED